MRKNCIKVIEAFKLGKAAQGDSKRTIWTDGEAVYSYNMKIAKRVRNCTDDRILIVARDCGPSKTTRSQIDALCNSFRYYEEVNSDVVEF